MSKHEHKRTTPSIIFHSVPSTTSRPLLSNLKIFLNEYFLKHNKLNPMIWRTLLLILSVVTFINEIGHAQITAGTAAYGTFNNSNSATISYTNSAGANKILVVGVAAQQPNGFVTSISYNGTALTKLGNLSNSSQSRIEIWYLKSPPVGTFNVVVSNNQGDNGVIGVMTFSGVNQNTPFGTLGTAQGSSTTASISTTSAVGELVYSVVGFNNGATNLTPGSGQTEYWDQTVNSSIAGSGSTKAGAASVTMSWTSTSASWTIGAVSLKPANSTSTCSGNLLQNPGFESSLTSWNTWGTVGTSSDASSGSLAANITGSGSGITQAVNALPGQKFTAEIWAKAQSSSWADLYIEFFNSSWTKLSTTPFVAIGNPSSYTYYTTNATAPANSAYVQIVVSAGLNSGGYVRVDNGCLTATSTVNTTPGGVPGASIWLKADQGLSAGSTLTWADQSGNNRNGVQTNSANQPIVANNVFNYNPALLFDGSNDHLVLQNLTGLPTAAAQVEGFAVANHLNSGSNWSHIFSYGSGSTNQMFGLGKHTGTANATTMLYATDAISSAVEFTGGKPVLFNGKYNGTQAIVSTFGVQRATASAVGTKTTVAGHVGVDPILAVNTNWNGNIPEIILFPTNLTATQASQVNSYLAIKYGITLDQTTAQNYIASNGSTVFWNATANTGYNTNIAGIARDDNSALNQKQSKSINSGLQVAIGNGNTIASTNAANPQSFDADRSALMWGDNAASVLSWSSSGAPTGREIIARKWKVQETGAVGSVKVQIKDGNLTNYASHATTGNNSLEIKTGGSQGQTFSYTSGNGSYPVNRLQLQLRKDTDAAGQVITFRIRPSWGGADLATATITTNDLTTTYAWYDLVLSSSINLTDGTTYYIRADNPGVGKIWWNQTSAGTYTSGAALTNAGALDGGKDNLFRVQYATPDALPDEGGNTLYLLVDDNSNFTSGATEIPMILSNGFWEANVNLANGNFFTFARGCQFSIAGTVTNVTPCFGGSNGTITLTHGGVAPFNFAWSASGGGQVPTGQSTSANLTGLVAGNYSVVVTDNSGCQAVSNFTVNQPISLSLSAIATQEFPIGGNNGTINLTTNGGTAPYIYDWADVGGTNNPKDRTNLSAGTYSVTISDNNGCTAATSVVVSALNFVYKDLYLSDPSLSLDRTDPVASADGTTAVTQNLSSSSAGILIDRTSTGYDNNPGSNTFTVSHTTGTGLNRLMLVGISQKNRTISSVTYGGTPLSLVGSVTSNSNVKVHIYSMVNPPAGTANVVVNLSGNPDRGIIVGVTTFTGVNQTTPLGAFAGNEGDSYIPVVNVSSGSGELVFDVVTYRNSNLTIGFDQTQRWNINSGSEMRGGGSTEPGSSTTTMGWSGSSSQDWAIGAVSIKPAVTIPSITFVQSPSLCSPLTIKSGQPINITSFISIANGSMPANPSITAQLRYGATNIATLSSPTYNSGTGLLTWTGTLSSDVTIPAGQAIELVITTAQAGVVFAIQYDSQTKPSKVSLPVTTYIDITNYAVYSAPYPGGSVLSGVGAGTTVYPRAVVTDPFGFNDITGLSINIPSPGTNVSATSVATSGCTRTYQYTWNTTGFSGTYSIPATAREGLENTVTDVQSLSFDICSPPVGNPVFSLGASSTRCQGATIVNYTATASNATGISYSLDAISLENGNTINASTGAVSFAAGWLGTSIITATATGCSGPKTTTHTVTITPSVTTPVFNLGTTSERCKSAGTMVYSAIASNSTGITYSLDAASLLAGNTINSTNGTVTFSANWSGTTTITASANGCNGPVTSTHVVSVIGVVAIEDLATGTQGNPLQIDVIANDLCDVNPSSVSIISEPANGFLQVAPNGVITYLPNGTSFGADQFIYQVCSNGPTIVCNQAIVNVTIVESLDNPCAEANRSKIFYLSFPENTTQLRKALWSSASHTFVSNNVRSVVSIKAIYPGTVIVYDHWEDGYESDITLPRQTTTEVWGDGNPNNGWAPGYPTDVIPAGGYMIIDNQFQYNPRVTSTIAFDGKDKILSSNDIAVSKITGDAGFGGGSPTFTVQNTKTNVVDITRYGKLFVIPFGEDVTLGGTGAFRYTGLFVKAATPGTVVNLDYNGDGTVDITSPTLNEGEVWFYDGTGSTPGVSSNVNNANDIKAGAVITSNHPVGVDLLFGGIDIYGTRNLALLPGAFYGSTYYCPVHTTLSASPVYAFFTNSLGTPITINWTSGTGATGTLNIPAEGSNYLSLSQSSGYKFESQIGESFTAVAVIDADADGSAYDWSFNMIPESRLSTFSSIAWAPGSFDYSGNYNPIWLTATDPTTVYVKFDGNLTSTASMVSPCGIPYDLAIPATALQSIKIFDTDNDQTGLAVYTCDGTKITAVWGQDPNAGNPTPTGSPAQDVGYVMQPRCLEQLIIANDDAEVTEPETPIIIGVMLNDAGFLCTPNPASISNQWLLPPSNGSIVINANGTITYTPNPGFVGTDYFEYQLCAIEYPAVCDVALVTIHVTTCFAHAGENLITGKVFFEQLPDDGAYNSETGAAGFKVNLYNDVNCNGVVDGADNVGQTTTSDLSGNYEFSTRHGYNSKDDFDPVPAFNDNDGGVRWNNNWAEVGDDANLSTGDVRILQNPMEGSLGNAIRLSGPSNGINRSLTFSGATGAVLKFSFMRQGLNTQGEAVNVQINGSTIFTINDGSYVGTDANYHNITIPLSSYNANGVNTLQFITNGTVATDDYFWIDNVDLIYFTTPSCFIVRLDQSEMGSAYSPSLLNTQTAVFSGIGVCNSNNHLGVLVNIDAINDVAVVNQDQATNIQVLLNDIIGRANLSSLTITSAPTNGSVVVNPDGTTTYTPNTGYTGSDQFNYRICSAEDPLVCDIATVFITVSCMVTPGVNHITGTVYYDVNLNGSFNNTETGVNGVQVQLYQDTNNNGVLNAGEPLLNTTTSNNLGAYQFNIAVPVVTNTVRDQFNTNSIGTGNNGTANWSAGWAEIGESSGYASGSVLVTGNRMRISNTNRGASRSANLSGALTATFSFDFEKSALDDANDNISVQVASSASGPWTTLEVLTFPNGTGSRSYDITGFISSATTIRFITSSTTGSSDYFYLDNVQIAFTSYSTATRGFIVQLASPLPAGLIQNSTPLTFPISFNLAGNSRCGRNFGLIGADLSIVKTDTPDPVMAGQNITYSIVVTNNGPTNAANVVVNDVLPAGLTLVSATPSSGTWTSPNWTIGNLPRGASRTLVIVAATSINLPAGTIISNTATVTSTTPDADSSNNTSTASTTIVCQTISISAVAGDPICENGSLALTASGSGISNWEWTGPNGFVSNQQNPVLNSLTLASNGTYQVTGTAANGCSATAEVLVNVRTSPIVDAGEDKEICFSFNSVITASASGSVAPYTFAWSNGLGSGNSKIVNPTATTAYSVTVTDANGCTDEDEIIIEVTFCPEDCHNAIDDDGDGLIDGADPDCPCVAQSLEVRVNAGSDDAEQSSLLGLVSLTSNDLELVADGGSTQLVGIRFNGISIPQGAIINNAYIEFEAKATWNSACNLTLQGQAADNPGTFTSFLNNLSSRPRTTASVPWIPSAWSTVGDKYQTPDISSIVQETVNRGGWSNGNSIVFFVSGTGTREAMSFEGSASGAPLLVVNFTRVSSEICDNGLDDDCDGLTDCEDGSCAATVSNITGDTNICVGESTTLSTQGNGTFHWNTLDTLASISVSPISTTTYTVTVTAASGCTATASADVIAVVCENCTNGIDDNGNGLTDCADPDCNRITLSVPTVSACIDHPLQDVATVSVNVSWTNAPANDTIEVSIYGQTERINVAGGAISPQTITFTIPADGSVGNSLKAKWRRAALCEATTTYNAPAACSANEIGCDILYLCGLEKPYDGDGWDHGWIEYLDEANGTNIVTPALTKSDPTGFGLYDPMNHTAPLAINLDDYGLIVISATTEGHIATGLLDLLKNFSGSVMNSNYQIINDLGMSASEGSYQFRTDLYVDDTNLKEIYNYNNDLSPTYTKVFTKGNYTAAANAYLWTTAGGQTSRNNGVYFVYESSDALSGITGAHGRRIYLGYHMNGLYANAENGGALPAPVEAWFQPATHLTLDGKYWLDMAILEATKNCNPEICNNGIDDNDNGMIDCADPLCNTPVISNISTNIPNNCPVLNNGSITITATGASLEYSIDGGVTYQNSNVFTNLSAGNYYIRVSNTTSGCYVDYPSNPVVLTNFDCIENCINGIDDDGDGLIDCADPDCRPTLDAGSNVNICIYSSFTISASVTGGVLPYSYLWDNGLGAGPTHTVSPLVTTVYHVTVSSASGCTAVDSLTITVTTCSEVCADGIDNDADGLMDCDDPDCQAVGQPNLLMDNYQACPSSVFKEQVIFNDDNLQNPAYSIASTATFGSVSINGNGVFTYIPNFQNCNTDKFVYRVCNQITGCCDTASVFLDFGDGLPPALANVPADITIGCDDEVPAPPVVYGVDGCPGIYISYDEISTKVGAGCQQFTITRTWTATDLCGNSGTASQVITVEDVTAPEMFRVYTLANGKKLVAGISSKTTNHWRYVAFPFNFSEKPLVFTQLTTNNEASAAIVRQRNITTAGFEMRIREEEAADGVHAEEEVAWMAIEPGALTDASLFQANLLANVNSVNQSLIFSPSFPSPSPGFIAAVQTTNDSDPMAIRFSNLTTGSVSVRLEEETSANPETVHGNEDLAWMAFHPGNVVDADNHFVGETGAIALTSNWTTVNLSRSYNKPAVIMGGLLGGGDPATIRVRNVTANSFQARIQEWNYLDGSHSSKTAYYFIVEGTVPTESENYCTNTQLTLIPGVNLFALDNCDDQVVLEYAETKENSLAGLIVYRSWTAADDCGNVMNITRTDTCSLAALSVKVNLMGGFLGNSQNDQLMRASLRSKGYVPSIEPYSDMAGFNHKGQGGGETLNSTVLVASDGNAVVDWVFIEIRDIVEPDTVLATCAGILQRDGDVTDENGSPVLYIPGLPEGHYFVAVKHRNHLGFMSGNTPYLSVNNVPLVDFTSVAQEVQGNTEAGTFLVNGKRAMWPGDFNLDGKVIYQGPVNDIFYLFSHVLVDPLNVDNLANFISTGYHLPDINIDGTTIFQGPNNDRAPLLYFTVLAHPGNGSKLANYIVKSGLP